MDPGAISMFRLSNLCPACTNALYPNEGQSGAEIAASGSHHLCSATFTEAVERKCFFCSFVKENLKRRSTSPRDSLPDGHMSAYLIVSAEDDKISYQFEILYPDVRPLSAGLCQTKFWLTPYHGELPLSQTNTDNALGSTGRE